jgi:soluble lytic murein transglycosylase-like protein
MTTWKTETNSIIYLPHLALVESELGIPTDLLARVAYQESSWRDEVVYCKKVSDAGAVGLMQMIPKFFPNAGKDWRADVVAAGLELRRLHKVFGDWQLAVAAYNDGEGNIQKVIAGTKTLPDQTERYIARVFADVPIEGYFIHASPGSLNA